MRLALSNEGNNAMQAEIRTLRANFLEWSAQQESWEIRMWCNIIARHLELLTREPHNLTLWQQTAAKVEQLRIVAARVVKVKKFRAYGETSSVRPKPRRSQSLAKFF